MNRSTPSPHVTATLDRIAGLEQPPLEKAEALVDVATDLQKKPKTAQDLFDSIHYLDRAVSLAEAEPLALARARAGRGSALRQLPGSGLEVLVEARDDFSASLSVLRDLGSEEEVAEVEMSLGLVIQTLASAGRAPLTEAVSAYQRALRTFDAATHPREYATIHNNLATAYLSMRLAPEKDKMREAMAVQSFQEALKVVSLDHDPVEYSMLQNNLGNALQAVQSAHRLQNLSRAVEAYDEALKVRTRHDMPVEYANTIANKANALMNLPDDPEDATKGNPKNLSGAVDLLSEARTLFEDHGLEDRAAMVAVIIEDIGRSLPSDEGAPA